MLRALQRQTGPTEIDGGGDKPGPSFGWKELAVTLTMAIALAVGLFVVIPLVVVKRFEETFHNPFVFNLVEGVIRIAIFLIYILAISLIPDLRRVFQYHGAEHKVIHAYEACGRPDAEAAVKYPPQHPRCGTGFLLVVMVVAILVFAIVGKPGLYWLVALAYRGHTGDNRYLVRSRLSSGWAGTPTGSLPGCSCGRDSNCRD